jgi:hypothetical protein
MKSDGSATERDPAVAVSVVVVCITRSGKSRFSRASASVTKSAALPLIVVSPDRDSQVSSAVFNCA